MQKYINLIVSLLLLAYSCSKNEVPIKVVTNQNTEPDIYVVGTIHNPNAEGTLAAYWKNDTMNVLKSNYSWGYAYSLAMLNSDLYIPGNDKGGPACWVNGNRTELDVRLGNGLSTYVHGSDIYITGYDSYLKNGIYYKLPTKDGIQIDRVFSVLVHGSDLYFCGIGLKKGVEVAMYWKNNQVFVLTNGERSAHAFSIFVKGQDVYIAGDESNSQGHGVATYWKNGDPYSLSNGKSFAALSSIFIEGSDIYAAGFEWDETNRYCEAVYWKNGNRKSLSNGNSIDIVKKIEVYNNVVYACGELNYKPVLWENDIPTFLNENGIANSFLIVKDGKAVNSQ